MADLKRVATKFQKLVATKFQVLKQNERKRIEFDLRTGDELCRGRMIPMSPQLITTLKSIYKKCQVELQEQDTTPVIVASFLGLADVVWGFIQCSKQTHTNIHTGEFLLTVITKKPLDFLWLQDRRGDTALDTAIIMDHVEVVKILLSYASYVHLESAWNCDETILLPLLPDYPEHDGFVFYKLEEETRKSESRLPHKPEIIGYPRRQMIWFYNMGERQQYLEKLNHGLLRSNPDKNTILHIVSNFGEVDHVKDILEKDPSLISCHNSEGETPVYVAAREGHAYVLQIMFNHLKTNKVDIESHLIRSKDKNNALHIAIQNHHAPVVFLLLKETPQLANQENVLKESPLYVAAERSYFHIVKLILNKCRHKTFTGPKGKTAVHAAAISNSECIEILLQERPDLVNAKDENGWSPWRYAVHYNSSLAMKKLLKVDHSIGYQLVTQDDTTTSALHIAASRGHCETIKVLMYICPGSPEFDSKGRNILHVAIESKQYEVTEFIFQDESLTSLINQKDNNGNTPAHLLAESNFEMLQKVIDYRVNIHSLNNENRTPLDMIYSDEERDMKASDEKREMIASDEKRERLIKAIAMGTNMSNEISSSNISMDLYEQELEAKQRKAEAHFKMVDNLVLVVTLIATATFAAAFTVPGGFHSDSGSKQGTPYLLRKAAFQAFVITNAIAFSCSFSVLLSHIWLLIYRNRYDEASPTDRKYIDGRIVIMYYLTGIALLAMLIAIVTGFYVVLLPSLWLAIFVCALIISIVVVSLFL